MSFLRSTGRVIARGLSLGYLCKKKAVPSTSPASLSSTANALAAISNSPEINGKGMFEFAQGISIMRGEVTVGLFKQVMRGYVIEGNNADNLKALLAAPSKAGGSLTYVSLLDAREFAKRLSDQTGRKFRVQTENDWVEASGQLSGNNWTWTETPSSKDIYALRCLGSGRRDLSAPDFRCSSNAVRLVEDK